MGGVKNLKVKNQETNLSVHKFLQKTIGNCYMGAVDYKGQFYGGIMLGKVPDDYAPEQLNVNLDFSNTNIHTFPKGMDNVTCRQLFLNKNCQFSNLDNFPTTSEGTTGLQLAGISDNETSRSFLEKVYGRQSLASNSHTDKNGDIVIHNDLLLGLNNVISPDALPHDFNKVKIGGSFSLGNYKNEMAIDKSRRPSVDFLKSDKQIDLSGYKDKIHFGNGDLKNAEQVILPQAIDKLTFAQIKTPDTSLDCSGVKNLEIAYDSDLRKSRLTMPKQADTIIINDSALPKGSVEIKNAKLLEIDRASLKETDLSLSDISMMRLSNTTLNSNSKIDASKSTELHLFKCDLSQAQEVKLPSLSESHVYITEAKFPRGDYDFSAQEHPFSLTFTEFTPDSTLKLPQVEVTPDKLRKETNKVKIPECYKFEINYSGVKFPEMEWNIFDIKNNGLSSEAFAEAKTSCEKEAFADKNIILQGSDLSHVKGFKLPVKMNELKINNTILPEGNVDLSGAKYLDISYADFSKCDQVKFPEKISELDFHQNKFKSGAEIDVSGVEHLRLWGQDFSNLKSLKLPPEAEMNIGHSQFPAGMDLDLSHNKSVYISESDLSNLKSLRLPEGFDINNNLNGCKLPQEVFIGEERYVVPQTEIKEQQAIEDRGLATEKEKQTSPNNSTVAEDKIIEKQASQTQNLSTTSEKQHNGNKIVKIIQKLRGINLHSAKESTEDKSKEFDLTNQQQKEEIIGATTTKVKTETNEKSTKQVSKRIKRLVNIARGIIQPKKRAAQADASHKHTLTQEQIIKHKTNELSH